MPTSEPGVAHQPNPTESLEEVERTALVDGRLLALLRPILAVAATLFLLLAALAWHSQVPDRIDATIGRALYAAPGTPLRSIADLATTLGKPVVVAAASLAVAAWVWRRLGDPLLSAFCPVAVIVTATAGHVVKLLVERHRPGTATLAHELDFSFPSGHATGATALAAAAILLLYATRSRHRRPVSIVLAAYAAAVCLSRLVIGVHYLSDIIAGSLFATAGVLTVGWFSARPWLASSRDR